MQIIPDVRRFGEGRADRRARATRPGLRSLPPAATAWIVAVVAVAGVVLTVSIATVPVTAAVLARVAALLALAVGYAEVTRRVQRVRTYLAGDSRTPQPHTLSVWSFGAVVALPLQWAVVFSAVLHLQRFVHCRRDRTSEPYRLVFTGAAAVASQAVAAGVAGLAPRDGAATVLVLAAAALVYTVLDLVLMLTGMALGTGRPLRSLLPTGDDLGFEASCLSLGVATGLLVLHSPWAAPVLVGPVLYLHRSTLVRSLREAARTDPKTGVLNAAAWGEHAAAVLRRCGAERRPVSVVVLDIDEFKQINDVHGHLTGDHVLTAVAQALHAEVRDRDAIGRFGGDEFVVVLEDVALAAARQVGERLRTAVGTLDVDGVAVSTSIGLAHLPDARLAADLHQVMAAADAAMYRAKVGGRDRLCVTSG